MKKIMYTRFDGGVSIITPANQLVLAEQIPEIGTLTEAEFLDYVIAKSVPQDATNVHVIDDTVIPSDRTFRDAWIHSPNTPGAIAHDKARCVAIVEKRLRGELKLANNAAIPAQRVSAIPSEALSIDELKAIVSL